MLEPRPAENPGGGARPFSGSEAGAIPYAARAAAGRSAPVSDTLGGYVAAPGIRGATHDER